MTDEQTSSWISSRRADCRIGKLAQWKIKRLELIPGWNWDRQLRAGTDWVIVAERLADANKGTLPRIHWLLKNGYSALEAAMRAHPSLFTHIKQDKPFKSIREWVSIAEELARKNGGILPRQSWLYKNGYSGMTRFMREEPQAFAHIEQERKSTSAEEWVAIAERLAQENGGTLRYAKWLTLNGYSGLASMMRRFPPRFSHIKQEKPYAVNKRPDEWAEVARNLAQRNGGVLHHCGWLQNNGYSGLERVMRLNPESFTQIAQEVRGRGGKFLGFRNGTAAQRRALEIEHGLRPAPRKKAA